MYKQREVDGHDTGAMWECPFLAALATDPQVARQDGSVSNGPSSSAEDAQPEHGGGARATAPSQRHVLCVSPYPHRGPSTNSCLYWVGEYQQGHFDIGAADGATASGGQFAAVC